MSPKSKGKFTLSSDHVSARRRLQDRFSPEEEARRHKFAWVQFGAGPRMCLGANFAMMSVTQIVATLVQAFHFRAIRPQVMLYPVNKKPSRVSGVKMSETLGSRSPYSNLLYSSEATPRVLDSGSMYS